MCSANLLAGQATQEDLGRVVDGESAPIADSHPAGGASASHQDGFDAVARVGRSTRIGALHAGSRLRRMVDIFLIE